MDYLQKIGRENPFKDKPGCDWWRGFLQRWPKLSERKAQHLSRKRAEGANYETIHEFFQKFTKFLVEIGIHDASDLGDRLWNCDESSLCNATTSTRILARRGCKWVHDTAGGSGRGYTTIHGCGSASGVRLPPFVIYKGKNLYASWTQGGCAGAMYAVTDSGWMERESYKSWFQKMFLPSVRHLTKTKPVVLIFDGHYSHIGIDLIETSRENNVHLMLLPSNTTHVMQPLDVGVYGPIKKSWKKILADYKRETRAANITKEEFPRLVKELWSASFTAKQLEGGFKESGLYPVSFDAIPSWKYAPALPLQTGPEAKPSGPEKGKEGQVTGETPLRTELRKCFVEALRPTKSGTKTTTRRKIQQIHYGEALTTDETLERLKNEEKEKKTKKARGKGSRNAKKTKKKDKDVIEDEKHCQICGALFEEDEETTCLGCDGCWRWVHCYCAGFDEVPDEDEEWLCFVCSDN